MLVSVSLLGSYDYCQRKVFLERVLKLFKPPKDVMVKGTVKHTAFELMDSVEESLVKAISKSDSFDSVQERYKTLYQNLLRESIIKNKGEILSVGLVPQDLFMQNLGIISNEARYRSGIAFDFATINNIFNDELWEKIIPKTKSEYSLKSENLCLSGRMDQLQIFPKDFVPVELKSGKLPRDDVWPGHKLQLAGYALLLQEKFNIAVNKGIVRYIDHDTTREVLINPFLKQEVRNLTKEIFELLNSLNLPDRVANKNKCNACNLKADCFEDSKVEKLLADISKKS